MRSVRPVYVLVPHHAGDDAGGVEAMCGRLLEELEELEAVDGGDADLCVAVVGYSWFTRTHLTLRSPGAERPPISLVGAGPFRLGTAATQLCSVIDADHEALLEKGLLATDVTVLIVLTDSPRGDEWESAVHTLASKRETVGLRLIALVSSSVEPQTIEDLRRFADDVLPLAFDSLLTTAGGTFGTSRAESADADEAEFGTLEPETLVVSDAPAVVPSGSSERDVEAAASDTPIFGEPGRSGGILGSSPTEPAWPDSAIDAMELPNASLRAASCRGRSHRFAGTLRQDAYAWRMTGDTLLLAIADGVSSGARSDVAARLAVDLATRILADQLSSGVAGHAIDWDLIVKTAAARILRAAQNVTGESITADNIGTVMSTTLLAAVVTPSDGGSSAVSLGYLGDTSAWRLRDGAWTSLTPLKNDGAAIASSSVSALPTHIEISTIDIDLQPDDALFLMSDGVGDAMGAGTGEVPSRLAELWASPPGLHTFGSHVDFQRKSFDDDRTVMGLWLRDPS